MGQINQLIESRSIYILEIIEIYLVISTFAFQQSINPKLKVNPYLFIVIELAAI